MTATTGADGMTLFERLWNRHRVRALDGGWDLIHIDRILLHDLSGVSALEDLERRGLRVANPALALATPDHTVPTGPIGPAGSIPIASDRRARLQRLSARHGIRYFDAGEPGFGIVHVMGPELGFVLPGTSVICGDSHTCTNGGLAALAFGIGASELVHALATQTLVQRRPATMRIRYTGRLPASATAKDLILHTVGRLGASAGAGCAIEYDGDVISALSMDERMTVCNMSIELGARFGLIAPDACVSDYLQGRRFAPDAATAPAALAQWRTLASAPDARFDRERTIDASRIGPQITWGTSPDQVIAIEDRVPGPDGADEAASRHAARALDYMGIAAGEPLLGQRIDRVFIGSCTNARLSDLRAAAGLLKPGRQVADGVAAWVVPGSQAVADAAEHEGLAERFRAAGFEWRRPGCSMCASSNGDIGSPGERVVSTSNRNFVGRQGPGVRTHLASPATATACALRGVITDPRDMA